MSKLNPDINFSKPGSTPCEPSMMQEINSVVTINVNEVHGLVLREVKEVLASLPLYQVQCITVQKAAALLSVYDDTIRVYIRKGFLKASKIGNDYRIRITDLQDFLLNRRTNVSSPQLHTKLKKVC